MLPHFKEALTDLGQLIETPLTENILKPFRNTMDNVNDPVKITLYYDEQIKTDYNYGTHIITGIIRRTNGKDFEILGKYILYNKPLNSNGNELNRNPYINLREDRAGGISQTYRYNDKNIKGYKLTGIPTTDHSDIDVDIEDDATFGAEGLNRTGAAAQTLGNNSAIAAAAVPGGKRKSRKQNKRRPKKSRKHQKSRK
jgi:hypothetical protein